MINDTMRDAINAQINREFHAAYLYLAMSAALDTQNFSGMAQWMRRQYEEELTHGLRLLDFVTDRGGAVTLGAIEAPKADMSSPLACFQAALGHERRVTADLSAIYDLAVKERDHAAHAMIEWFLTEQVEEEKTVEEIVTKLKLAGDNGAALLMMEAELAKRPAANAPGGTDAT